MCSEVGFVVVGRLLGGQLWMLRHEFPIDRFKIFEDLIVLSIRDFIGREAFLVFHPMFFKTGLSFEQMRDSFVVASLVFPRCTKPAHRQEQ